MGEADFAQSQTSQACGETIRHYEQVVDESLRVQTPGGVFEVQWSSEGKATAMGQLAFFAEFLQASDLFGNWLQSCPLRYTSPNAPLVRDVLGSWMLGILDGQYRYAHIGTLRGDGVAPEVLGMSKIIGEDSLRRALGAIAPAPKSKHSAEERAVQQAQALRAEQWMQAQLRHSIAQVTKTGWILDCDTTVKVLYGHQDGAVVSYNPQKPGRPSHIIHTYWIGNLRLVLDAQLQAGNRHSPSHGRGRGLVVATGRATELGKVAGLLEQSSNRSTPLQLRLAAFGKRVALAVLAICAVIFGVGILRGEAPLLMLLTAISLAVAAIPEALPAVVTVLLALVIALCTSQWPASAQGTPTGFDAAAWLARADALAALGLRVLAVARRNHKNLPGASANVHPIEAKLCLIGLIGLMDPPRPEAAAAVRECMSAGITPVMITGTNLSTLDEDTLMTQVRHVRVYARVDLAQKIRIVQALQAQGEFVAMTGNSGELWTIALAPLLPIHILWVNLVTDGLPGLALAAEPAERGIMQRPPRAPSESLFSNGMWQHILGVGLLLGGLCLGIQAWAISTGHAHWQTMVFTVLTLGQMAHVLAIRSEFEPLWHQGLLSNKPLLGAVLLTFALQMATIYIPALNPIFKTQPLSLPELVLCLAVAAVVWLVVEIEKAWRRTQKVASFVPVGLLNALPVPHGARQAAVEWVADTSSGFLRTGEQSAVKVGSTSLVEVGGSSGMGWFIACPYEPAAALDWRVVPTAQQQAAV